jgi:methionine synthase II (cobalamin-independent)
VLAALPGEVLPMVHCCASKPPLGLLVAAGAKAVSVDATLLDDGDGDLVAETLEAGAALLLGVVDARQPDLPTVGEATDRVRRLWHVASQPEESVRDVATTPTCGLAGSTPETARAVLERCREVAQALADDPERPHD